MTGMRRRTALLAGLALLPAPRAARGAERIWRFDQGVGRISFIARHVGLFSSTGRFERFQAMVALDPDDLPAGARIEATVDTTAITHPWPAAGPLLRSEAFFDSARWPAARFAGRALSVSERGAFPVEGTLSVRGIERPFRMEARLAARSFDAAAGGDVAEFEASGELDRTQFGMVAERDVISDAIGLSVRVRLRV